MRQKKTQNDEKYSSKKKKKDWTQTIHGFKSQPKEIKVDTISFIKMSKFR